MINRDEILRAIANDLDNGKVIAAVSAIDLKRAWDAFVPYTMQAAWKTPPPTIQEIFGLSDNATALFFRCALLAGLTQRGATLTESMFEEMAVRPLDKDSIAAFMEEIRKL